MKVFHFQKYKFLSIQECGGKQYYAFECIKRDFDPEIVLVRQAKVVYSPTLSVYFDTRNLDCCTSKDQINSLCVNQNRLCNKYLSLVVNENNGSCISAAQM